MSTLQKCGKVIKKMNRRAACSVLFLSWGSPWPPLSGGDLRTWGLLCEISKAYPVHLLILTSKELSNEQREELYRYVQKITCVPMAGSTIGDQACLMRYMLLHQMPYHCAKIAFSFRRASEALKMILSFPGVIYASYGHWGALVSDQPALNWILDQHNADVDFWRVYASQATNSKVRLAAWMNYQLAKRHFPFIYTNVGRIISVCEEDRQLTRSLAPSTPIDVIENGVDCSYFTPRRADRTGPPRLLFTGTSAPRNVTALRGFVRNIFPLVKQQVPDVELLVAGNFSAAAQAEFAGVPNIRFTGRVDDIRPYFDQSDVYIAPFAETHGSKLKIAEAMAMAMPIVSTPQGVRGFALVDGESVLIARNNNEFSKHVISLISDPPRRKQLGENAREVALTTIDWPVLGKRLIAIVEEVFEGLSRYRKIRR